jgi:hypothetical protein
VHNSEAKFRVVEGLSRNPFQSSEVAHLRISGNSRNY